MDLEKYKTTAGKLEYADMRELETIIVTKTHWPLFERRFHTKEALQSKFSQLADIRNALRHSRAVDEVVRKEGEAAIIWFDKVLAKEDGEASS